MGHDVNLDGFSRVRGVLNADEVRELLAALGPISAAGRRGILSHSLVARLSRSARVLDIVRPYLPADPIPVRAIYFNKSPQANWSVSWHQDVTLALRSRSETPGFGPWSVKDGIPHAHAPVELLEEMLTLRLHLDEADPSNGALRVLPGSHRLGRLSPQQIENERTQREEVVCSASPGDVLLMRPLLLHASGRSTSERPRRVLHIEYAAFALPAGLVWHDAA